MTKIINVFNHKGGVSKTTTVFNLGWMLAEMGKKVIVADFDPQCNLTGMVLRYERNGFENFSWYENENANNVRDVLKPAFESQIRPITHAECMNVTGNDNLMILPGHIGLSEYETILGFAQDIGSNLPALSNVPGSLKFAIDATAYEYDADYVLVDMSPSLGSINQNLMMVGDHFIVPFQPGYFSNMAMASLGRTLPQWKDWADKLAKNVRFQTATYPFPTPKSKFIGAVVQNYVSLEDGDEDINQEIYDGLVNNLEHEFIPILEKSNLVSTADFVQKVGFAPWEPILEVPNFTKLITLSQKHKVPVYALSSEQIKDEWDQIERNVTSFGDVFRKCAEHVIALTS